MKGEPGEMVAPAGKPLIVTFTEPLKPFWPTATTVKLEFELPGAAVSMVGEIARLKSARGLIVKASGAECEIEPEFADTVSGKLPVAAGTAKFTVCCFPAATVNGVAGDVRAPAGSPEIPIVTGSAKPFCAEVATVKLASVVPAVVVRALGETERLKSPALAA